MKGALHNGMSLFQDLKLKRRKVDSRCSSDGESIGTSESTSSLSPDAQAQSEGSPKDKDRCVTPEELVVSSQVGSKPNFPPQFFFMMKAERGKDGLPPPSKTNGVIKLTSLHGQNGGIKHMMKSEMVHEINGIHGRKDHKMRNGDMHKNDIDIRRSLNSSSNSNSDDELERKSIKSEKLTILDEEEKDLEMAVDDENDNDSGANMSPPMLSRPVSNSSASGNSASNSPPGPRLESTLIITKANKESMGMGMNHLHRLSPPQNHLHARLTSPMINTHNGNNYSNEMRMNGTVVPSPLVHAELRNLAERPDPLSVVTSTSLSFHHQSMYRINGVRPEVISGGAVTPAQQQTPVQNGVPPSRKSPSLSRSPNSSPRSNSSHSSSTPGSLHSPSSRETLVAGGSLGNVNSSSSTTSSNGSNSNHHHVNLNRTPTVIMGEAGGVRTMLWSQPGQPISNPPGPEIGLGMPSSPPNTNGLMTNGHNGTSNGNYRGNSSPPNQMKGPLSMERLWRDSEAALNLSTGRTNGTTNGLMNGHHLNNHNGGTNNMSMNGHGQTADDDDYEQPMICMICEDRATGLHYGIITCEGCKGFFKRTVQNRRVYTCVADGTCEITKAQRNRCQYCRFKKCIEQGMVLQAVREDRMPGGRNSGAVYNLYKVPVKYRKHKKGNRVNGKNGSVGNGEGTKTPNLSPPMNLPPQSGGNILKAALTSPNEVNHLRPAPLPFDTAAAMITHLVQCDNFHDIAALQNWEELLEARGELSDKLCQMGDSIVCRLVQWAKRLPFYQELSTEVHTRVLTHKWHELLVLTTSAWQAMHTPSPHANLTAEEETMENLQLLQRCLQAMMGRSLTLEQLRQDVGQMVERLTFLTRSFRRLGVRIEEYVTLKVIAMLQGTKGGEVGAIQERYIKCLRTFLEVTCPSHPNRLSDLLRTLPEVQAAASLLLESKMFYVPFLLNSALLQR